MLCKAAVAGCLLLILNAAALAQSAPPTSMSPNPPTQSDSSDSMDQPLPGDHWTYEIRDEITGSLKFTNTNTITDVTPTEIAIRTEWLGKPGIANLIYDHSWNLKNNQIWKYSPNDGTGVKLPLKVGSSWNFQSNDINSTNGIAFKRTGSSKVVGEESVTTGAGTFDTFKIEMSLTVRNALDPTKKSESTATTWYAPSINHWVKQTWKSFANGHVNQSTAIELVEYGRR